MTVQLVLHTKSKIILNPITKPIYLYKWVFIFIKKTSQIYNVLRMMSI